MCPVQARDSFDHPLAIPKQVDLNPSAILRGTATLHKPQLLAARYQRYHTVLLCLQTLGQLAYGRPLSAGIPLDMQHHQILQGCNAMLASYIFAEADKLAYLITELGQHFKITLVQRPFEICWHGISIDNGIGCVRRVAVLGMRNGTYQSRLTPSRDDKPLCAAVLPLAGRHDEAMTFARI